MRTRSTIAFALVLSLGLLAGAVGLAHADPYTDALPGFTEGSLSDTGEAIDKVISSGNPLAAPLLQAAEDARLMFSAAEKKVFIKTKDDKLLDAATGKPYTAVKPPEDIDTVIVNNRLRGAIDAAIGSLTLMSANSSQRYDAAQAVFKSRDASALPALEKALAAEKDARVKNAMNEARAAIILTDPKSSVADKAAAIAVIRDRGDQDALGLLDGLPPRDQPADVHAAAAAARAKIQRTLAIWNTVQHSLVRAFARLGAAARRRSVSPSPSASWASSIWRMAKW